MPLLHLSFELERSTLLAVGIDKPACSVEIIDVEHVLRASKSLKTWNTNMMLIQRLHGRANADVVADVQQPVPQQ